MKSYEVKFWAIRPGKAKTKRTYEVRGKVGHPPQSRTLGNKAQADNFLSELRQESGSPRGLVTNCGQLLGQTVALNHAYNSPHERAPTQGLRLGQVVVARGGIVVPASGGQQKRRGAHAHRLQPCEQSQAIGVAEAVVED